MSIYDRDYMRSPEGERDFSGLWYLIIINVILFFIAPKESNLYNEFALSFNGIFTWKTVMQLFTAGFLHGGYTHLLVNMWGLYLFGSLVIPRIGKNRFLWLYIVGVLSGNLLFLLFNLHDSTKLIGASGAVCAVMIAAAMVEPDRQFMLLFLPVPMKTKTLVVCYTVLEILMSSNIHSPIAHLAHLGGFIGGYLFMKFVPGLFLVWDPFRRHKTPPFRKTEYRGDFFSGRDYRQTPPPPKSPLGHVSGVELDRLLDKISREGINSLSDEEMERLRQARREMRGE